MEHKESILKEGIIARITKTHTRINFKDGNDIKAASKIILKQGKDVIKAASSLFCCGKQQSQQYLLCKSNDTQNPNKHIHI